MHLMRPISLNFGAMVSEAQCQMLWTYQKHYAYIVTLIQSTLQVVQTLTSTDTVDQLDMQLPGLRKLEHLPVEVFNSCFNMTSITLLTTGRTVIVLYPDGSDLFVPF